MDREDRYMELAGTIQAVLYQNEENGYCVLKMDTHDGGGPVTTVGCLPWPRVGEDLILTGEQTIHPTHGEQFQIKTAQRHLPTERDGIFEFLSSGAIKGVGPATAALIINVFGDETLKTIEREPLRLTEVKGISRKRALEISTQFKRQLVTRRLSELLGGYDIKPAVALRLYRAYGDDAMDVLIANPYVICSEAIGAQFSEADALALDMGFEDDCPERVAAATIFELRHNTGNGHCFIPLETLAAVTSQLIQVPADLVEDAIELLTDSGELVRSPVAGREGIYLASLYQAEEYSAQRLIYMSDNKPEVQYDIKETISRVEEELSVKYAPMQLQALKAAAENRVMVLTGGPGTGKTTTVRAIVALFDQLGIDTLLAAPTGRAAKRMTELTGREAFTVHRLLEAGTPDEGGETLFRRNEDCPLKCGALILDECSMVDIILFRALLSALPEQCRLVLVGDADQLPSVGPGNVFNDIIRSGVIETVRLTEIFRQTGGSLIVANAHRINRGEYPPLGNNSSEKDFFFLRRTDPGSAISTVCDLYSSRLPNNMGIPRGEIQVLIPTRKGEAGTNNLNRLLQKTLNPPEKGKKEKIYGDIVFRQGDRVMQIRNNYDIIWQKCEKISEKTFDSGSIVPVISFLSPPEISTGVFNGDVGIIADIDHENELMTVFFEDRLATYSFDALSELEHAYAITVHKSQGSEYRAVILLALDGSPQLMSRKVLYTAVTRARDLLVVVGAEGSVLGMIDNHKATRRFSGLRARLAGEAGSGSF